MGVAEDQAKERGDGLPEPRGADSPTGLPENEQVVRIRRAAVQLFTRHGYAGTTMKQLASALGMAPGNLYNYYARKDLILFDVLRHELVNLLVRERRIVEEHSDPVERVQALAYDLLLEDLRNPMAAFVGRQGVSGLTRRAREEVSRLMADVRGLWLASVEAGVAAGQFRTTNSKLSTLNVLTLCSATSSWYRQRGEYRPEEVAAHTALAALRILGYSNEPPFPFEAAESG